MTSIDHHLSESEKMIGRGFDETDAAWALVYQQAATAQATIALAMATAQAAPVASQDAPTRYRDSAGNIWVPYGDDYRMENDPRAEWESLPLGVVHHYHGPLTPIPGGAGEYRTCGATIDRPDDTTYTCARRAAHEGGCGPRRDA